jgi:hypothetical protein
MPDFFISKEIKKNTKVVFLLFYRMFLYSFLMLKRCILTGYATNQTLYAACFASVVSMIIFPDALSFPGQDFALFRLCYSTASPVLLLSSLSTVPSSELRSNQGHTRMNYFTAFAKMTDNLTLSILFGKKNKPQSIYKNPVFWPLNLQKKETAPFRTASFYFFFS